MVVVVVGRRRGASGAGALLRPFAHADDRASSSPVCGWRRSLFHRCERTCEMAPAVVLPLDWDAMPSWKQRELALLGISATPEEPPTDFMRLDDDAIISVLSHLLSQSMRAAACACRRTNALMPAARVERSRLLGAFDVDSWRGGASEAARAPAEVAGGHNNLRALPNGKGLVGIGSAATMKAVTQYGWEGSVMAVLKGPTDVVCSVATDGVHIASGDDDGEIHLWLADTHEHIGPLPKEHDATVYGLALRGDLLVSGSADKKVKLWSVSGRACTATLTEHTDDVNSVAIGDEVIASGSDDDTARTWSLGGSASRTLPHPVPVYSVHVDGDVLATGCGDGIVRTWSIASGQLTRELRGHGNAVWAVSLSGSVLVSGGADKRVKVWALGDDAGECVATCEGHSDRVTGVALSASGGFIASLGNGSPPAGELIVWRPA